MNRFIQPLTVLMLLFCNAVVVNADDGKSGFEWLKQFEGSWKVEAKEPGADEVSHTVTMESHSIGDKWMVSKQSGKMGEMDFEAVQTVGYDAKAKKFVGTWVDSTSSFTWQLSGTLDESGKKLTLGSEGADWSDPTKKRKYRDVYEFKSENEIATVSEMLGDDGKWKAFMTSKMTRLEQNPMAFPAKSSVTPFLMFIGKAEEAIEFYKTVFPDLKIDAMTKYEAGDPAGTEGTVKLATISIAGQKVMCIDSPPVHDFTFTPSFSFFVECKNLETMKKQFAKLSDGGKVMMPLADYGFSDQFGWTSDKFGVSWQLNLNGE